MGFVIFVAIGLYFMISLGVVASVVRFAKKQGTSAKRWGWSAALVMFLIPGWDWIPTVATHQFYCTKDSGVSVYKTLDQWKAENPGVMKTLTSQRAWPHKYVGDNDNYTVTEFVNQRFNLITKKEGELFLHVWRWQRELIDTKTNEVLARYIDFSTGNGHIGGEPELKFWLHSDYCINGRDQAIRFGNFFEQFIGLVN